MTNPTPHGQVPEALRLAEEITNLECSSEAVAKTIAAAADELCRLHVENASLRASPAASPTPPVEQQTQPGAVYAELHEPDATTVGLGAVWNRHSMRDFADRTHALRIQAAPKAAPGEPDGFGSAEHWKEKAQYWAGVAHRLRGEALRGEPVDGIVHPPAPQQEAQEPAAFIHWPINGPPRLVWYSQKALNDAILKTHEDGYKPDVKLYAAPQPAPATQQAGDVVAYLDVGAGGYLDLGSELSEDALQQLPKGRHALVIAGTYGIDGYVAAPQPSLAAQADSVPAIQGEMNVQLGCGAEPPGIQALMCVISSLRDIAHFSDEEGGELMSALCALRDWAHAQTVAAQGGK